MISGSIFDIQRFSLFDGPGIRTTVFFKGCPLSCFWCCNPESQSSAPQLGFFKQSCRHCLACIDACSTGAHYVKDGFHSWNVKDCTHCGDCIDSCPHGALKMYGAKMSVAEVLAIIENDKDYYTESGGGLTISGGEPFEQYDFLVSLLKKAGDKGFHKCVETTGFASTAKMAAAAIFIDLFLFDFKAADEMLHKKITGVSNKLSLENLHLLNRLKKRIILRCPIIPGFNDTTHHFRAIVEVSQNFQTIESIEIMPFHNFGRSKASAIGKKYSIEDPSALKEQTAHWEKSLLALGCKKIKMKTTFQSEH